jgi:hypothetical protein
MGVEVVVVGQNVVKGEITNVFVHVVVSEPLLQTLVVALLAVTMNDHLDPCLACWSRHGRIQLAVIAEVVIEINSHLTKDIQIYLLRKYSN